MGYSRKKCKAFDSGTEKLQKENFLRVTDNFV